MGDRFHLPGGERGRRVALPSRRRPRRAARAAGRAATLALLLAALACAAPAVPIDEGSRVVVRLHDAENGLELALANESYPELADVYSRARPDGSLKLAPDRLLGELLHSLGKAGLDLYGRAGGPDGAPAGRGWLLVEHDGEQRIFLEPAADAPVEERQAYARMELLMDHYYSHVGGLQFVDNPAGHDYFEARR